MDGKANGLTNWWMDEHIDGWIDKQIDGRMDKRQFFYFTLFSLFKIYFYSKSFPLVQESWWQLSQTEIWRLNLLLFFPGALFSLNGPAALVGQKDSARPPLVAASCLPGLPGSVCPGGAGQQAASGPPGERKERQSRERAKNIQTWTVLSEPEKDWIQQRLILLTRPDG